MTETDAMERGVHCPECGSHTSFGGVVTTGQCAGRGCETTLALELVVE